MSLRTKAYYIAYSKPATDSKPFRVASEITQIYHPLEYGMAYWNKFNQQIHILFWKELTSEELEAAVKSGGVAMNLLR